MDYFDGSLTGEVSFDDTLGLENGAKVNFRCFPIIDIVAFVEDNPPEITTVELMNTFITEQIDLDQLDSEVFRGQIFCSTSLEQPYNIT